jgi:DNA-binding GntR family transcriptional regulator
MQERRLKPLERTNETPGMSRAELAYERIETLLAHMELAPGAFLTMAELQARTGLGRMPVLEATRRLSDDTLLEVRAGRGIRVFPIDPGRERRLLRVRHDLERFAIEQACERASTLERSQMRQLASALAALIEDDTPLCDERIRRFNEIDRRMDRLVLKAASEPFVERTLRPLHTLFRRLGYLFLTHFGDEPLIRTNIRLHQELLEAVIAGRKPAADDVLSRLMAFAAEMMDPIETSLDPALLDAGIVPFDPE